MPQLLPAGLLAFFFQLTLFMFASSAFMGITIAQPQFDHIRRSDTGKYEPLPPSLTLGSVQLIVLTRLGTQL